MSAFSHIACASCRRPLAVAADHAPEGTTCCPLCAIDIGREIIAPVESAATEPRRARAVPRARPRRRAAWRATIGVY
jgi:hypothetical protein